MHAPDTTPTTSIALPGLAAWRRTWTSDGVRFVGADGAVTVSHERALPADLLCDQLAARGAEFRRGVTAEGEHVVRFTHGGRRTAWVLGDRHMAVVEADAAAPSLAALVDTLAWTLPLRLGGLRARRFEVTPPAGWRATAHGLTVRLEAPDGTACLSIPAATPLGDVDWTERFVYEDTLVGLEPVGTVQSGNLDLPSGLVGEAVRVVARHRDAAAPVALWTVLLLDDRYRYAVRLEAAAPSAALEALFARVVDSIHPVPRPAARSLGALLFVD